MEKFHEMRDPAFPNLYIRPHAIPPRAWCSPVKEGVFREYLSRSVVKAVSYRIIVVVADFAARWGISIPRGKRKGISCTVYLFTNRVDIALGFVVVSNIYTSVLYFLHERFWDRVAWGRVVD